MTNELSKKIRRVYGVVLSISIFLAGACLIGACVGIYRTGDHPFSREVVAQAFRPISLPVYLCLALTLLGFPLNWWLPREDEKRRGTKQDLAVLRKLDAKTDLARCDETLRAQILAEEEGRRSRIRLRVAVCFLCALVFGIYVLSGDRFLLPDINSSMIRAMCVLLPCLALSFNTAVFTIYRNAASVKRQIELMKQASAQAPKKPQATQSDEKEPKLLRGLILAAAVAILIFGFLSGGAADVLTKAINICTECVGLG